MNKRANNIVFGILLTLIAILLYSVGHYKSILNKEKQWSDTVAVVHYDTIHHTIFKVVEKPKPYKVETIKHDTIYQNRDTSIVLPVTRKWQKDTIFFTENDTAIIETTIVGINPSLERINALLKKRQINQTTETIINTHTEKKKKSHIHLSPQLGVGYGFFNKDIDVYGGVGISITF